MVVMIISMSAIIKINECERILLLEQNVFQETMNFYDMIAARGIEINLILEKWQELTESAANYMNEITNNPARIYFTTEINEKIDILSDLWVMLEERFKQLDPIYESIAQTHGLNTGAKLSISSSGFLSAIAMNNDIPAMKDLEFSVNNIRRTIQKIQSICDSFESTIVTISEEIANLIKTAYRIFMILVITITTSVSALALLLATRITRKVVRRINKLQDLTSKLSQKDFSMRIDATDNDEIYELSEDLNSTVGILNDFLITVKKTAADAEQSGHSINDSAISTATATHEINANTESLGKLVDKLSAAVTKSMDATNQMIQVSEVLLDDNTRQTAAIHANQAIVVDMAENLGNIALMAEEKTASAQKIQQLVQNGDEKIFSTYSLLKDINGQLDEVAEIVNIINDIAEQTNILSMNAAIESAHAGESGKGFGVVAEEIRQLAESTADNATRITSSLYTIISTVKDANTTSKSAADAFQLVSEQTKDMIVSLGEITTGIRDVNSNMHQITGKNTELSNSSNKITDSCDKLSAHQNLVSSEMNSMSNIFHQVQSGIREIKSGTANIVTKMIDINTKSSETCAKMEKLDYTLAEFTTVDFSLHGMDGIGEGDTIEDGTITSSIVPITEEEPDENGMTEVSTDEFLS